MTVNFVPGDPSPLVHATAHARWKEHAFIAYGSGNNLVILTSNLDNLQTIYLTGDAVAVSIHASSGMIAVAVGATVQVFRPEQEYMTRPRWVLDVIVTNPQDASCLTCLDWSETDLVVGSHSSLSLWNFTDEFGATVYRLCWFMEQPNPVYLARLTRDSCRLAVVSRYDRLVKLWNRNSFDTDHTAFDLVYLKHPVYVTNLRWRWGKTGEPHALYTMASDRMLRVWASYEVDTNHSVSLWGTLDLGESLAVVVDRTLLKAHADAVLLFGHGQVEVVTMTNVSSDPPKQVAFEREVWVPLDRAVLPSDPSFAVFCEPLVGALGEVNLVLHDVRGGSVRHIVANLPLLTACTHRGVGLAHMFTGHSKSVQQMVRSLNGSHMLSRSRFCENVVWAPLALQSPEGYTGTTLAKTSLIATSVPLSAAVLLDDGTGPQVVALVGTSIELWDARIKVALQRATLPFAEGPPLCFLDLPEVNKSLVHVVALYRDRAAAWVVDLVGGTIKSFPVEALPVSAIHRLALIDPVGWTVSLSNDNSRDVLTVVDAKGVLRNFSATIASAISWVETCKLETGLPNISAVRASSIQKVALVDEQASRLTLWDTRTSVLEHEEPIEAPGRGHPSVGIDLDWTSTPTGLSILSVGFASHILMYCQLRYDYTNSMPSFVAIKKISIAEYTTHAIADSLWLADGTLVVAAGNQFYVSDRQLDLKNDPVTAKSLSSRIITHNDIFHLCSVLNGPLPVYHPQFLIQCLFLSQTDFVQTVLLRLHKFLRRLDLEPELSISDIRSTLGLEVGTSLDLHQSLSPKGSPAPTGVNTPAHKHSQLFEPDLRKLTLESFLEFSPAFAEVLVLKLTKVSLPYLTRHQQATLVSVVEILLELQLHSGLDLNGLRFFLGWKLYQYHRTKQESVSLRDINFALHSESQEALLQLAVPTAVGWNEAKSAGLPYWLSRETLLRQMESIAGAEFNLAGRVPTSCSVFYLALKKKQILLGLWRTCSGHPEQQKMLLFLRNDFKVERWRLAAMKNAFVLLGKHRFLDAACFFLLADQPQDCCRVIARQVGDTALAIAVARVYDGDAGPVMRALLESEVFPKAVALGDRWTTSWAFWVLGEKAKAVQLLLRAPSEMVGGHDVREAPSLTSQAFLQHDPLLLILFANLRHKDVRYLHGSLDLSPTEDFDAVARVAGIYERMGCEYLAVALLRGWRFISFDKKQNRVAWNDSPLTELSLGTAYADTLRALASPLSPAKAKKWQPPPSSAFTEPDMSAFGF